jgi:hypothetical protein
MAALSQNGDGGSRPVPDPTLLTTQQTVRGIVALREVLEARMDGADKVTALLKEGLDRRQSEIDAAVGHLKTLHEEKFHSIAIQFSERDTRTEQTAKDSKVAVDAALQAAKEAVGEQNKSSALAIAKSEGATTKQIDLIGGQIAAIAKNMDDKIGDLKDRINIIDGRTEGTKTVKDDSRANVALGISALLAIMSIGSLIYSSTHVAPPPSPVQITNPAQPGVPPQINYNITPAQSPPK